MAKIEYFIYRIKFIFSSQTSLPLYGDVSSSDVMIRSMEYIRTGSLVDEVWRFGNWQKFGEFSGTFSIGRVKSKVKSGFDEAKQEFFDEQGMDAPHTNVVYDAKLGVIAIQKKGELSPNTNGVSNKLKDLLQSIEFVNGAEITVRVDLISDPKDFITQIKAAFSISKFVATVTGPNPIDADELFQKPISTYLNTLNGNEGKVEINGPNLDSEGIIAVAKSTASTGNKASAVVKFSRSGVKRRIKMGKNALVLSYEDGKEPKREEIYGEMMQAYHEVRDE